MNDAALAHVLKSADEAVRIMFRDRSTVHAFDVGKTPEGVELVMVLAIVPKAIADKLPWVASLPQ